MTKSKEINRFYNILEYSFKGNNKYLVEDDEEVVIDDTTEDSDIDSNVDIDSDINDEIGLDIDNEQDLGMGDDLTDDMMGDDLTDDIMGDDSINNNDDIVIDVDDLTQSQEATEDKVDNVTQTLSDLSNMIQSITDTLNQQSQQSVDTQNKVEELEQEIKERNPLPIEKLKMRSLDSYPYNQPIDKFWDDKIKDSNYELIKSTEYDDDDYEFIITQDDIDKNVNWSEISKSLSSY